MAREPKQRIRDAGDAQLAMEGAFETGVSAPSEPAVAPPLQVWQRPVGVLAAVVTAGLVCGLAVWSLTRPSPQAVSRFEIPLRAQESFTGLGRHAVAVSPDGRQIVYATDEGLALRSLDQVTPALVAGTDGGAREPFFSPDGQSIGFFTFDSDQLQKVFTSGSAPVTLADAENPWGASCGADDMILYGQGS